MENKNIESSKEETEEREETAKKVFRVLRGKSFLHGDVVLHDNQEYTVVGIFNSKYSGKQEYVYVLSDTYHIFSVDELTHAY